MKKRSYKLLTPEGMTSRRFTNLVDAWRYFRGDCPDLTPRDLVGRTRKRPLFFADGYTFYRSDI